MRLRIDRPGDADRVIVDIPIWLGDLGYRQDVDWSVTYHVGFTSAVYTFADSRIALEFKMRWG